MGEMETETDSGSGLQGQGQREQLQTVSWLRRMMNVWQIIAGNVLLRLMDAAGVSKISILNSLGAEVAKLNSLGGLSVTSLAFPATPTTPATANTIGFFEEGDWTPTWLGTTTNPTVTYTTQQGHYVRVGNMVTFTGTITISAVSVAGTGNLRLGGLPFTISANQGYRGSMFFGYAFGFTAPAPMAGIPVASSTQIGLFGYNSTDARTDRATFTLASSLTASTVVFFAGTYAI